MLLILGIIMIVAWVLGLAFKVTSGLIHIGLVIGVILFVAHFIMGRRGTTTTTV